MESNREGNIQYAVITTELIFYTALEKTLILTSVIQCVYSTDRERAVLPTKRALCGRMISGSDCYKCHESPADWLLLKLFKSRGIM